MECSDGLRRKRGDKRCATVSPMKCWQTSAPEWAQHRRGPGRMTSINWPPLGLPAAWASDRARPANSLFRVRAGHHRHGDRQGVSPAPGLGSMPHRHGRCDRRDQKYKSHRHGDSGYSSLPASVGGPPLAGKEFSAMRTGRGPRHHLRPAGPAGLHSERQAASLSPNAGERSPGRGSDRSSRHTAAGESPRRATRACTFSAARWPQFGYREESCLQPRRTLIEGSAQTRSVSRQRQRPTAA